MDERSLRCLCSATSRVLAPPRAASAQIVFPPRPRQHHEFRSYTLLENASGTVSLRSGSSSVGLARSCTRALTARGRLQPINVYLAGSQLGSIRYRISRRRDDIVEVLRSTRPTYLRPPPTDPENGSVTHTRPTAGCFVLRPFGRHTETSGPSPSAIVVITATNPPNPRSTRLLLRQSVAGTVSHRRPASVSIRAVTDGYRCTSEKMAHSSSGCLSLGLLARRP